MPVQFRNVFDVVRASIQRKAAGHGPGIPSSGPGSERGMRNVSLNLPGESVAGAFKVLDTSLFKFDSLMVANGNEIGKRQGIRWLRSARRWQPEPRSCANFAPEPRSAIESNHQSSIIGRVEKAVTDGEKSDGHGSRAQDGVTEGNRRHAAHVSTHFPGSKKPVLIQTHVHAR